MAKNVRLTASALQQSLPRGVLVHASADENFMEDPNAAATIAAEVEGMQAYVCAACDTHLTASADSKPFCINCGSVTVPEAEPTAVKARVTASTILAAVGCDACGTTMTLQASAINACGNRIHCSTCGNHMHVALSASTDENNEYEVPDNLQAGEKKNSDDVLPEIKPEAPAEEAPAAASEVTVAEEAPMEPEVPEVKAAEMPEEETVPLDAAPSEEADVVPMGDDNLLLASDESEINPDELVAAPAAELTAANDAVKMAPHTKHEDSEGVCDDRGSILADAMNVDDTANDLSFISAAGRVVALKAHVTVFSLRASDAGDNVDLIESPQFISAVKRHVQAKGLRAALQDFGFKPVRVPVVSQETVKASITAATAKVEEKHKVVAANMEDALAIAATGLNSGRFRNYENPLRAALSAELSALGIRNPNRVVAKVFERYGITYTQNLLAAANSISRLSAEARKDMKDMLNMTREITAGDEEAEVSAPDTPLEARLTAAPIGAVKQPPVARLSASVDERAQAILAGKAPLSFNF